MHEIYTIYSETGDEYKLEFTTERIAAISKKTLDKLRLQGIEVLDIGLGRSKGINITSHKVLCQIEECIAEVFLSHPNIIISFFCDFISLVPRMKRRMPVQEYRSVLFTRMFEHYVSHNHLDGVCNRVVSVEGLQKTTISILLPGRNILNTPTLSLKNIRQTMVNRKKQMREKQ